MNLFINNFEVSLADHGVRKYEDYTGRFTTPEPLWEKYYSWSPYHYCRNNPISRIDGNGFADFITPTQQFSDGVDDKLKFAVSDQTVQQNLKNNSSAIVEQNIDFDNLKFNSHFLGTKDTWKDLGESVIGKINSNNKHREDGAALGLTASGEAVFKWGGTGNPHGNNTNVTFAIESALTDLKKANAVLNITIIHSHGWGLSKIPTDTKDYDAVKKFGAKSGMVINENKDIYLFGTSPAGQLNFNYNIFDTFMNK